MSKPQKIRTNSRIWDKHIDQDKCLAFIEEHTKSKGTRKRKVKHSTIRDLLVKAEKAYYSGIVISVPLDKKNPKSARIRTVYLPAAEGSRNKNFRILVSQMQKLIRDLEYCKTDPLVYSEIINIQNKQQLIFNATNALQEHIRPAFS